MGAGASCTLTLKIAKSGKYPAKTSTKIITRTTVAPTTTTVAPTTTTTTTTTVAPTTTTTTTTTVAPGPRYSVGDTGPGGGIVFYVDLTRASGSQYFEAACAGWQNNCDGATAEGFAEWGCDGTPISGADGTAIGTGEQNTTDIVTGCSTAGIAARLANDLTLGGQSDWFLPSKDELNALCKWAFGDTVNAICNDDGSGSFSLTSGGFSTDGYWSSSELDDNVAWYQNFYGGGQYNTYKSNPPFVRPVRAF